MSPETLTASHVVEHFDLEPALGGVDICRADDLDPSDFSHIAARLHQISASESAILERPISFYLEQLRKDRIFFAMHDGDIVGMVGFIPLSSRRAEVSGAWVHPRFRQHKIYIHLRTALHDAATRQNFILLATNKPHIDSNIGAGMTNLRYGFLPTPYWWLEQNDPEAFKECCCCEPGKKDHVSCPERDVTCFLMMQQVPASVSRVLQASEPWQTVPGTIRERAERVIEQ